jgi:hypothetical protein
LIPGVVKRVAGTTTKNMQYALVLSDVLETITNLFYSSMQADGSHNPNSRAFDLADTMRMVFDSYQKFYQHHFINEKCGEFGESSVNPKIDHIIKILYLYNYQHKMPLLLLFHHVLMSMKYDPSQ